MASLFSLGNAAGKLAGDPLRAGDGAAHDHCESAQLQRVSGLVRRRDAPFGDHWNGKLSRKQCEQVEIRSSLAWTVIRVA